MAKLIEITGKAISGEWGNDDESGNGIPVLRTTNFTNTGIIDFSNVVTRDIKKKNISDKFLRKGDIIIEKSGGSDIQPVGRVVYFEAEENKYLFNNFTGLLRVTDNSICYSKYLFYSLFYNYYRGGTVKFQNKTTGLHNLKIDDYINNVEISLPTIETQHQIAENLDKVTHLIDLCNTILEKLDLIVKARFVEMFGDPVSNPMNWETMLLGDLTTKIGSGATPKGGRESYGIEGISLIRSTNVHNGYFEYKGLAHISDEQAEKLDNVTVKENDVLLNITGASVARCCIVPFEILPARVNQHVCIIRCKSKVLPMFICSVLTDKNFQKHLWDIAESGATREAITKQQIENLSIIIPPLAQQQQFVAFVKQTDQPRLMVKKVLEKAETLKKTLMQEYFE